MAWRPRRGRLPAALGELHVELVDLLAGHRLAETARDLRHDVGVGVVRGGLDDRACRASAGSDDLKMPLPTNTDCAPSCITSAASAGVAMPPAQNSGTGSSPRSATSCTRSSGALSSLAQRYSSSGPAVESVLMSPRIERRWRTASTMLPVPASPFERISAAPSPMPPQRLAEIGRTAHERHGERPLVDVVRLVGRGEHLRLVDVVDAERLQHLRLGEVADPALRHHRDRDGLLDALDHRRIAHARDAAVAADVGRHPLERHHGRRAGVFGDLGLLGRRRRP